MKTIQLLTFIILFNFSGYSQKTINTEQPHIVVTGKAEKNIVPNEIYIDVCIEERIEKGKKITIQQQENQLKIALTNASILLDNLTISDVNSAIVKTGWWSKDILASANYELKVNGAEKLKKVFEIFEKLKISKANITKATHSELQKIRKEIRIIAIKEAKKKADYLLNAIGEKTGKPMVIKDVSDEPEANFASTNMMYGNRRSKLVSLEKSYRNSIVQFKKIKVSSSIYVKFGIK